MKDLTLTNPNHKPSFRPSIRNLMIAIAILAVVFSLRGGWFLAAVIFSPLISASVLGRWLWTARHSQLAGISFLGSALLINGLYVIACRSPVGQPGSYLAVAWLFVIGPALAILGNVWNNLATRQVRKIQDSESRRWLPDRSLIIILLTVMPFATAVSLWPFQSAFLIIEPDLDRLADQVAAGKALPFPISIGGFRVIASEFDAESGRVSLKTGTIPAYPQGFVRRGTGSCEKGPCDEHQRSLGIKGRWCYHEYET